MRRLFATLVLIAACSGEEPDPPPARGTPPGRRAVPASPTPAADEALVTAERRAMGTLFVVRARDAGPRTAQLLEEALDAIERLEAVLSEWRPESEISAVNAAAGRTAVAVSPDTFTVVEGALEVARASEGAFDPTWAALRGLYDFHAERPTAPEPARVAALVPLVRYQDVQVDAEHRTVRLARRGMALGLGGIGKGYALDRAAEVLLAGGVQHFMIYGGGQVQVHGRRSARAFRVGIQHPRKNALVASFDAGDVSISTSGDYEHAFFTPDGVRMHHIVDPATGLPARRTISVTVVSPSGMRSDALSTAVFVLGPDAGLAMLREHAPGAEAAVIGADCALHVTPGLAGLLHFEAPLEPGNVVPGCREP